MFMRFLWGFAIGHTYAWKDQENGSAYYAVLEELLSSSFSDTPELVSGAHPGTSSTRDTSRTSAPAACGEVPQAGTEIDISGAQDPVSEQSRDRNEPGTNDDEDDDWNEGLHDGWGSDGEEEYQDEWDLRDDDEVLVYDEMYNDWYLDE
jgi:hypothetical protein